MNNPKLPSLSLHLRSHLSRALSHALHLRALSHNPNQSNLSRSLVLSFQKLANSFSRSPGFSRWTAITQLAHHGILFVPVGYTFGAGMFKMDSVRGGSPYGAGVFAGDGTRGASETELALAEHQGKYMASVVKKLAA